mmetsp:Transcript_115608/g.323273  ORF Transcript_115608/g.323273 Transcript_115608/m.323273 type:complete len:214 (-) Transcript_115608:197-838(-)
MADVSFRLVPVLLAVRAAARELRCREADPVVLAPEDHRLLDVRRAPGRGALRPAVLPVAPHAGAHLLAELHPGDRGGDVGGPRRGGGHLRRLGAPRDPPSEHALARHPRHRDQGRYGQHHRGAALRDAGRPVPADAPGLHDVIADVVLPAAGRLRHVHGDPHHGRRQVLHARGGRAPGAAEPHARGDRGRHNGRAQELCGQAPQPPGGPRRWP